MQVVPSLFKEDLRRQTTLASHTQAVENAIQIMHTNIFEPLNLADLADAACLSPFHFNRVFRSLIGAPPGEFLAALRLQMARRLLLTTSLSVTHICFEVGYTSPGSFTTRFTQLVGLSPRLFRQKARDFMLPAPDSLRNAPMVRYIHTNNTLEGYVTAPAHFKGIICVGLFMSSIAQGAPVSCTKLFGSGSYRITNIPNGTYYLLSAAFPIAGNTSSYLQPNENMLVARNIEPLMFFNGAMIGNPDLVLHAPRLTDPPLIRALLLR